MEVCIAQIERSPSLQSYACLLPEVSSSHSHHWIICIQVLLLDRAVPGKPRRERDQLRDSGHWEGEKSPSESFAARCWKPPKWGERLQTKLWRSETACPESSCCWSPGAWAEMSICAFPLQSLGASQREALQPLVHNSQGPEWKK